MRCFADRADGFYVDVGAGHPVHDNVSFAFYLKGWRGLTVEPNRELGDLSRAIRPRDTQHDMLVGAAAGETTFYLIDEFHGFSTTVAHHAQAVAKEFGKASRAITLPVTTLAALCAREAPPRIDFLKVDVEGGETEVLAGNDWRRFRPQIVLVEALAPCTLAPAWESWEAILTGNGYRYAFFDSLNRYYVAEEADDLAARLQGAPASFDGMATQFGTYGGAREDASHPDHALAILLGDLAGPDLPFVDQEDLLRRLAARVPADILDKPATATDLDAVARSVLGRDSQPHWVDARLGERASLRDVYVALVETDPFRTACGRIAASYRW